MGRKPTKTPEERAAAVTAYKNTWQRDNKDRIPVNVKKGDKEKIAEWAKSKNYPSTNAYICGMIENDMKYDTDLRAIFSYLLAHEELDEEIMREAGLDTYPSIIIEHLLKNF